MTKEKFLKLLDKYQEEFEALQITPMEFPLDKFITSGEDELNIGHCYRMLPELRKHIEAGKMEKAYRWLGFIQGCMWSHGIYTIDMMRGDNR